MVCRRRSQGGKRRSTTAFLRGCRNGRAASPRPFFAFLNYLDAHAAYIPPAGQGPSLRRRSRGHRVKRQVVYHLWPQLDKTRLPQTTGRARQRFLRRLFRLHRRPTGPALLTSSKQRGELKRTLVIVTSDHGEAFGEHQLFDHGKSLYRTEIRVPLVIVPPGHVEGGVVIHQTVGLQDLAATITDLVRDWRRSRPYPASRWRPCGAINPTRLP